MSDTLYGLLAVLGSIISFGMYSLPVKSQKVKEANVSPMVFQVYAGLAVSLSSLLVLTYNEFIWSWWGVLGAGLWMSSQPFAFFAINLIGVALAPAIWAGTTIVVSFIWGAALFGEGVQVGLCVLAIVVLIAGIAGVTASGTDLPHHLAAKIFKNYHAVAQDHHDEVKDESHEKDPINSSTVTKSSTSTRMKKILGVICALIMGVMNGSLMVPFTLYVDEQDPQEDEVVELGYLASFSIGIFIVTPIVFAVFFLLARQKPVFHFKVAFIPGLTTGILWSIGNFCSLYATLYLGSTVGYPLTQTCIVVSGLFGIFYFHEIHGPAIWTYAISTAIVLGGAAMLAYFGA